MADESGREPRPPLTTDNPRAARLLGAWRELIWTLRKFLAEVADQHLADVGEPLPGGRSVRPPEVLRFRELIGELGEALDAGGFQGRPPALGTGEFWSLATLALRAEPRRIVRGFVEPVLAVAVVEPMPDPVLAYIAIPGHDDLLKREHHDHFGWHYHYLNWKKERSDRILCWDTRAAPKRSAIHPLFQEPHAERGRTFPARPDLWGESKRRSMHEAVRPDLTKWTLDTFKPASNEALPVWPDGSVLTPRAGPPNR